MERSLIRQGMKVTCLRIDGAKVFEVTKINPKTIRITNVENEFDEYNASPGLLEPVAGEVDENLYAKAMAEFEVERQYGKGVVVTVKGVNASKAPGYQVITNFANGKAQLFPLGGSPDGRYFRGVHYSYLEIVAVDELLGLAMA